LSCEYSIFLCIFAC